MIARLARRLMGVVAASAVAGLAGAQAPPEMRACWVSRFNWTEDTQEETRARITSIMENLKASNFNAVLFQVRGECNTLYPSPYEPWGPQFNWTAPGWDPVAFAIEQAHANGLEFHAYFNTHTLTATVPPPKTTPQHPYNLHGPDSPDSWVIHDREGKPVASTDSYTWLSPSNPDASAWTRQALMHLVETYDVDGVHFDRIRTPAAHYSFDPKSVARFEGDGNPQGGEWGDFMRDAITQDLRRIYGAIALRKPHVKITAAPFGICRREPGGYQGTGTQSYHSWYQDSFGWMEQHVVDGIFPMIYWGIGSNHPFEVLLGDFLKHTGGRHVYAGIHAGRDPIAQIAETRRQGAPGSTIWSYGRGGFSAYLAGPYAEPAPVPPMPWKENPTTAIVAGTVSTLESQPVLDAWVRVEGIGGTSLTAADGFYTVLDLPPGTHTITAEKPGYGNIQRQVTVAAGDVVEVALLLPAPSELLPSPSAKLLESMAAMGGSEATRLTEAQIRDALEKRTADAEVHSLFHRALRSGKEEDRTELLRAIEARHKAEDAMPATGSPLPGEEAAVPADSPLMRGIVAIEQETGGTIGVTAIHLRRGVRLDHKGDEVFPAASVIKTHLLTVLFRRAERGDLSLDDRMTLREEDKVGGSGRLQGEAAGTQYSLRELARLMIVISDNVATNMLIRRLGGMDSINAELREIGIERSRLQRFMMDGEARKRGIENDITPAETAGLFAAIDRHEAAAPATCDAILQVLLAQELNSKIPSLLPAGTRIAHKTGTLEAVSHDAGIIYAPSGPIALAVLTKGIPDGEASEQAIGRVARLVYDEWGSAE